MQPFLWSAGVFIISLVLALYAAFQEKGYLEANQISLPSYSAAPALLYFFGVLAVLTIVLFLIPVSRLRIVFRVLFALMYTWGVFVISSWSVPFPASLAVSLAFGIAWFFLPKVWLQDLLLISALAGLGSVFGFLFSPWAIFILLFVVSIYDFLAVRFGYMMWLAKKLSGSMTLPAFIIPKKSAHWNRNISGINLSGEAAEREFSILGGGDIGFPLVLVVSVFLAYGLTGALVVAAFSLAGLLSAYLIQILFLKGKPMPALPPITIVSFLGFLIVLFINSQA